MKQKLLFLLVLLLTATTGAMAQTTYKVSVKEGTEDATNWAITPEAATTTGVDKDTKITATYSGTKHVKSVTAVVKAAAPAVTYTLLSAATTADVGKVVCADGHLHDAQTAVPDGCTAVGILGKVTETGHGLILALQDSWQTWNTINGWTSVTTYAGTTLKVLPNDAARGTNLTSYTTLGATAVSDWCVAQKSDYETIFANLGSEKYDSDGYTYDANVNAFITTGVGGSALSDTYWSNSEFNDYGWAFSNMSWSFYDKTEGYSIRPVLGF